MKAQLTETVSWGLRWLAFNGENDRRSPGRVELTVEADGPLRIERIAPPVPNPEPQALSIGNYGDILLCAIAFGTSEQRIGAALVPEKRYQSLGEVVHAHTFDYVAGLKALALNEPADARARIAGALTSERARWVAPAQRACLSLIDRDWPQFERHLVHLLREHQKMAAKSPGDAAGALNLSAMALCRLAIESGYVPEQRTYLPLSLLPIWPASTGSERR